MNRLIILGILFPCTIGACWWGRQDKIDKKKRPSITVVRMIREDSRTFPVADHGSQTQGSVRGGRHPGYRLDRQLSTVGLQDVDLRRRDAQNIDGKGEPTPQRDQDITWWSWLCCCCMQR